VRILSVSTFDAAGGAEKVARELFRAYRAQGHESWLAVGTRRLDEPDIFEIPREPARVPAVSRWVNRARRRLLPYEGRVRGAKRLRQALDRLIYNFPQVEAGLGRESMQYPGSRRLLSLAPALPQVVHAHNLHGDYFDLRQLPALSQSLPLFLSLHDAWLLSGHCAHSFGCQRWRTGCGACPDLSIPPAIPADATAYNWARKRGIYRRSRLYVATPCQWLMDKVKQSILADGIVEARLIPTGINLEVFRPGDKAALRAELGLPLRACVIVFASNNGRYNRWKDFPTMLAAVQQVAECVHDQPLVFMALGDNSPDTQVGQAQFRSVRFVNDPLLVARYYQASDIYLHAARADTFPLTVLEALACGLPVIGTAVGGIPEQVQDGVSGFLIPPADVSAMAARIEQLAADSTLRQRLGEQALQSARDRFDARRFTQDYLRWFADVLSQRQSRAAPSQP